MDIGSSAPGFVLSAQAARLTDAASMQNDFMDDIGLLLWRWDDVLLDATDS
jgi:hypothetical protein